MLTIVLILVYIKGICGAFESWLQLDIALADVSLKFHFYLILALFWPITVWFWMYLKFSLARTRSV